LRHPLFRAGTFNTGFIDQQAEYFKGAFSAVPDDQQTHAAILAAVLAVEELRRPATMVSEAKGALVSNQERSLWRDRARLEATNRGGI
jgi:hypothetical protein